MTPCKIQDPEGLKTTVMPFKIPVGAIYEVHMQTYKIVCFGDIVGSQLRLDTTSTAGGKHDPSKQGRRGILIYKSYMYKETSLDQERCNFKADQKARNH